MAEPKDPGPLRERSEDGKRGYRDGVRDALRILESAASLEEARASLERLLAAWGETGP